jgi:hypothetical protein
MVLTVPSAPTLLEGQVTPRYPAEGHDTPEADDAVEQHDGHGLTGVLPVGDQGEGQLPSTTPIPPGVIGRLAEIWAMA